MKLELQQLTARHPAASADAPAALQGLDLLIQRGEQLAVIGPSGAGKTTLMQIMSCALRPVAGTLNLAGTDPWTLSTRELQALRGRLFLAPQVPPLPPRQRVVTSVLAARLPQMGLLQSIRSLLYPVDLSGAHQALGRLDMADKIFERVDRLSGGERQRVALARSFLSPAQLWLVDEPLSALDPARVRTVMAALTGHAREQGITLVATLHQVDAALQYFPRVIGLRQGRIAFDRPASAVSPELLARLYEDHEGELTSDQPAALPEETVAVPAVMHCR